MISAPSSGSLVETPAFHNPEVADCQYMCQTFTACFPATPRGVRTYCAVNPAVGCAPGNRCAARSSLTGKEEDASGLVASKRLVYVLGHTAPAEGVRKGILASNPFDRVYPPQRTAKRPTWSADELRCFLAAAGGERID